MCYVDVQQQGSVCVQHSDSTPCIHSGYQMFFSLMIAFIGEVNACTRKQGTLQLLLASTASRQCRHTERPVALFYLHSQQSGQAHYLL